MDSILGAEILKTRKRWIPYVLFVVSVVGVIFLLFVPGYATWKSSDFTEDETAALHTFVLPYSFVAMLDSGQFWGSMFVGILAASVVSTEYSWGTVRQVLIRGQTRGAFLLTKIAAISIISAAMLLTVLAIGVLVSIYATTIADKTITLDAPDGPSLPEMLLMVLRAALCILPYGMFAFMLATTGRSGTLGVAGIIIFVFGESILVAILDSVGGIGPGLADISIGENVKAVLAQNEIPHTTYNSLALRELPPPDQLTNPNVAALVLLAHTALYALISFTSFSSRDIKVG